MAGETVILDPSAVAVNRTQLDITTWIHAPDGVDWGDSEIQAYMADQTVGSTPVDFRIPNRQVHIPLNLRTIGTTTFSALRTSIQQKVALFQREGGWVLRQIGATNLYADVVNATLHLGGSWLQAFRDIDVDAVLSLELVPDFYGDEVTLDSATVTGNLNAVLKLSAATAAVGGNHPGRCRILVTDTSGNDQHSLFWGFRSRHYDAATTAALAYEAEALTPINGAAATALAGASGGTVVTHTTLPGGAWVPVLVTNLVSGNQPLTHQGSYRVIARGYSASALPQYRLVWGVGSLSSPVTNTSTQIGGTAAFYELDLGTVRIDPPPVGPAQWFGTVQVQVTNDNDPASIDKLFFVPLDEAAGYLASTTVAAPTVVHVTHAAGTAVDDASTGLDAWANPTNVTARDSVLATATTSGGGDTHWLKATGFGFNIPAGATIKGIVATFTKDASRALSTNDQKVMLVKAGTIQTVNRPSGTWWPTSLTDVSNGGSTDLWGGTWTPTDINNAGFGVALSAHNNPLSSASVDYVTITVYYALSSGFTVATDAVVYASSNTELRTEGMFRAGAGGVYGPVSQVTGDLPRIPPSGSEARPVELFVNPSRGSLAGSADAGLDSFTAQVKYRPSYLYTG